MRFRGAPFTLLVLLPLACAYVCAHAESVICLPKDTTAPCLTGGSTQICLTIRFWTWNCYPCASDMLSALCVTVWSSGVVTCRSSSSSRITTFFTSGNGHVHCTGPPVRWTREGGAPLLCTAMWPWRSRADSEHHATMHARNTGLDGHCDKLCRVLFTRRLTIHRHTLYSQPQLHISYYSGPHTHVDHDASTQVFLFETPAARIRPTNTAYANACDILHWNGWDDPTDAYE